MIDGYSGNEHSLPLQPLYNDVVQFVAKTKTYLHADDPRRIRRAVG